MLLFGLLLVLGAGIADYTLALLSLFLHSSLDLARFRVDTLEPFWITAVNLVTERDASVFRFSMLFNIIVVYDLQRSERLTGISGSSNQRK